MLLFNTVPHVHGSIRCLVLRNLRLTRITKTTKTRFFLSPRVSGFLALISRIRVKHGKNLRLIATSGAKSDVIFLLSDLISYKGDEILRLSCLVIEIPIFGYLGFWGYLATSVA